MRAKGLVGAGLDPKLVAASLVLAAVGVAVIGARSPIVDEPGTFVSIRLAFSLGLATLALLVFWRGAHPRLAWLLVVFAFALDVSGLTAADSPGWFTVGRLAVPVTVWLTVYVCFAYPTGRLDGTARTKVLMTAGAVVTAFAVADVLVSRTPPTAGPFTRCSGSGCPPNPLPIAQLGPSAAQTASSVVSVATGAFLIATAVLTLARVASASRPQRRSLAPLFGWTVLAALGYGFFIVVRVFSAHASLLTSAAVVVAGIIATMPLAIGLGIARGRMFSMAALEHLIADLGQHPSLGAMERVMAHAFADPTLTLVWRSSPGRYVDTAGRLIDLSATPSGRHITQLGAEDGQAVAVIHDAMLSEDRDVLEAAGAAIRLAFENAQLHGDLSKSIAEIEASRQRVASAADAERRRIEQDLHDGAQQDLIALRIKLQLLEEATATDATTVTRGLADAGRRVESALGQIRDLAKGVYPAELRDLGLSYALAAMAREAPIEISLHLEVRQRFASEVETAVYFCCFEGLQNVAKHCGSAARADLVISKARGGLQFALADNGPGFDLSRVGATRGITGMRDRLAAVGGRLEMRSTPGAGTTVIGYVPLPEPG